MNSFFRISIIIMLFMLAFILVSSYVDTLEDSQGHPIFDHEGGQPGPKVTAVNDEGDTLLFAITGNEDEDMNWMWVGVVGIAFAGVVLLAWMTHSLIPIGLHIYATVFWTSYWRMTTIFSYGGSGGVGYLDPAFIFIITGLMVFLFIGAVIGMLTGSG